MSAPDYGPPVDASGRVPGVDVEPQDVPRSDVVDRVSIFLDADGSGLYPSLYLVEARPGDVVTYLLSGEELPGLDLLSWRTRTTLRAYCLRLLAALDAVEARNGHPSRPR